MRVRSVAVRDEGSAGGEDKNGQPNVGEIDIDRRLKPDRSSKR